MAYLVINIREVKGYLTTPAQRNKALRVVFTWIGAAWHRLYKMKKFEDGATARYGLTPREGDTGSRRPFKRSYTEAKLKRRANGQGVRAIGETKPFVWSGKSRSDAKASNKVVATASRGFGKADCIINAPTLNFRPKKSRINLREEFERVTDVEANYLEREGALIYEIEVLSKKGEQNRFSA